MVDNSSRSLLIAILVVASLTLATTLVQTGLLFRTTLTNSSVSAAMDNSLPTQYAEAELGKIASRITVPYNNEDVDALYAQFDDIMKDQISRDKFEGQLKQLWNLVGKVESSSFVGSQRLQNQGRLDMYQLNYVVRLTGGSLPTGNMMITVVNRPSGPGIVGFFINGKTQQ